MYPTSVPQLRIAEFVLDAADRRLLRPVAVDPYAEPAPAAQKRHRSAVCPRPFKALLRRNPSLAEAFRLALAQTMDAQEAAADPLVNRYLHQLLREL